MAYNPPVDAVQEVRVHAFEADAAYGHTGGGTGNVGMKGGTNAIHGSLYEFNQVSRLQATNFFHGCPRQAHNLATRVANGGFACPELEF